MGKKGMKYVVWLLLIVGIIGLNQQGWFTRSVVDTAINWLNSIPFWQQAAVYVVTYIAVCVFFLPGSVVTLAGGFVFGFVWGSCLTVVAASLGAACAFLLGRFLLQDWVRGKIPAGKLAQLLQGIDEAGWRFVAFVRLIPLLPFNLLNYALGVTRVSFVAYCAATAIFIIPGVLVYSYIGSLGRDALTQSLQQTVRQGVIALSVLVLLMGLPWMMKLWQKK